MHNTELDVSFHGFVTVVAVLIVAVAAGCYGYCAADGLHDAAFEAVEYFQVVHTGPWPLGAFSSPLWQKLPLRSSIRVERSLMMHYLMLTLLVQHRCPLK